MKEDFHRRYLDRTVERSVGTGYQLVETTIVCVITRFKFRSIFGLLWAVYAFRQVKRDSKGTDGLLSTQFGIESWRACTVFSLWETPEHIGFFNSRGQHIRVANVTFRLLESLRSRVHLWSAEFSLRAVSPSNLTWEGVDIRPHVRLRQKQNTDSEKNIV